MREGKSYPAPEAEQQWEALVEDTVDFVLDFIKQGPEWQELVRQIQSTSRNLLQNTVPDSTWSEKDLEKIIRGKIRHSLSEMSARRLQDFLRNFSKDQISQDDLDGFFEEALSGIKNSPVQVVEPFDPRTLYLNQLLATVFSNKYHVARRAQMEESSSESAASVKFTKKTEKPN